LRAVSASPEAVLPAAVHPFIERARDLTDEDRVALADARRGANEVVRAAAWKAAAELLPVRAHEYTSAWARIGPTFIPERLEELLHRTPGADTAEIARWQEVARLVRTAIDDALLALLLSDTLTPPHIRELYEPWRRMASSAYEAGARSSTT
jgi:hypothetical protein